MILHAMARTRFAKFVDHLDTDCCWVTTAEDRPADIGFSTPLSLFYTTLFPWLASRSDTAADVCLAKLLDAAISAIYFHANTMALTRSNGDKPIAGYTGQEQR